MTLQNKRIRNIHSLTFIAPSADIIDQVEIGKFSSVWYGCALRGDVSYIVVGENTNIQDGTIIHVDRHNVPTIIGDNVTIGHRCLLHACHISSNAFVGMGAIVMDKAIVEPYAMVAAGALITPGKVVKTGEIWAGSPAKFFRNMTQLEMDHIEVSSANYVELMKEYAGLHS